MPRLSGPAGVAVLHPVQCLPGQPAIEKDEILSGLTNSVCVAVRTADTLVRRYGILLMEVTQADRTAMGLSQDELNFLCNTLGHAIHASRGLALYRDRFPAHCEGQTLACQVWERIRYWKERPFSGSAMALLKYLREEAPRFDADSLIAKIIDEAERAEGTYGEAPAPLPARASQVASTPAPATPPGETPWVAEPETCEKQKALVTLTEAVCWAVATAASLVNESDNWPDTCSDLATESLRAYLEAINRGIMESNELVERAAEFRGHYATAPEAIAGRSDASYHELGRHLAMDVFRGVFWAADHRGFLDKPDIGRVLANLPRVKRYLQSEAPRFDSERVIAMIHDEGTRAMRAALVVEGQDIRDLDRRFMERAVEEARKSRTEAGRHSPQGRCRRCQGWQRARRRISR